MCIECSGIHRSLGVHISKVRSITLDAWDPDLLEVLKQIGNNRFNEFYEANSNQDIPKPKPSSSRDDKDNYIRAKYVGKLFVNKQAIDPHATTASLGQSLWDAVLNNDILTILKLLAMNVDVNWPHPQEKNRTALHVACEKDLAACVEYLMQNNARSNIADSDGHTPADLAHAAQAQRVLKLLERKDTFSK